MSARVSVPALVEQRPTGSDSSEYVWRTDLSSTHSFWEGWFGGLSKRFLEARGGKLLILAGTDRLDKELMIGQMQGALEELLVHGRRRWLKGGVDCSSRQIPARGRSRGWALRPGGCAREDGRHPVGVPQTKRPGSDGSAAQSGRLAQDEAARIISLLTCSGPWIHCICPISFAAASPLMQVSHHNNSPALDEQRSFPFSGDEGKQEPRISRVLASHMVSTSSLPSKLLKFRI